MKHRRKERAKSGVRAKKRACEVRSVREKRACSVRSAHEKKSVRSEERVRKKERAKWGVRTKYSAYEEFLGICRLLIEPLFDCRLRCSKILYYNGKKLNENGPVGLKFNGIEISRIFDILLKLHSYDFQIFS